MKTLKITILMLCLLLLSTHYSLAQNTNEKKLYHVHEDQVKLSMVSEYESVVKELISLMKKNDIQNTSWISLVSDDSRYSYVEPIKNMAQLDQASFVSDLVEKEGKDVINGLFNRMDKCYDTELDYTLQLDSDLTYMPEGFTQTPEGQNYRHNHMLYVSPGNRSLVKEKMKAVKTLFATKGSKVYYRVYRSGFGANGEYYMVAIASKDPVDDAQKGQANNELIGEDGQKLFGELFSTLLKYEVVTGWIRPDLGYAYK
jgi:hypothetical protein